MTNLASKILAYPSKARVEVGWHTDGGWQSDSFPVGELQKLAESHERLLAAARASVSCPTVNHGTKIRRQIEKAIEQAEELYER